jgi:hypothetical protein
MGLLTHCCLPDPQALQKVYGSTKSYVCCTLPGAATDLWVVSTAIGWLLLGVVGMAFGAQALLDKTPTQGRCCGWKCVAAGSATDGTVGDDAKAVSGSGGDYDGRAAYGVPPAESMSPAGAPQATYGGPPDMEQGQASAYPAIPRG